jgi:mono/diheme cytochrome c family protein
VKRKSAALAAPVAAILVAGGQVALAADEGAAASAAPSPELAAQGKALYTQLCSHCHGVNMVNAGTSSFDLRKFPHDDQARFVNSVTHGKKTMPAWGDLLQPDEVTALWAYVLTGGKM